MPKSHSKSGQQNRSSLLVGPGLWAIMTGSFPFRILLLLTLPSISSCWSPRLQDAPCSLSQREREVKAGLEGRTRPPSLWLKWDWSRTSVPAKPSCLLLRLGCGRGRGKQTPWMRSLPLHSCFEGGTFTHQILTLFCRLTPSGPRGWEGMRDMWTPLA